MVGSTQAQNEIHPVVYKFPSVPPFHTLLQIKAALALHRRPLEQGWLCSSLPHSRCRETHSSLLGRALLICLCLGLSGRDGAMLRELRDLGSDPCSNIKTDGT